MQGDTHQVQSPLLRLHMCMAVITSLTFSSTLCVENTHHIASTSCRTELHIACPCWSFGGDRATMMCIFPACVWCGGMCVCVCRSCGFVQMGDGRVCSAVRFPVDGDDCVWKQNQSLYSERRNTTRGTLMWRAPPCFALFIGSVEYYGWNAERIRLGFRLVLVGGLCGVVRWVRFAFTARHIRTTAALQRQHSQAVAKSKSTAQPKSNSLESTASCLSAFCILFWVFLSLSCARDTRCWE